MCIAFYSHPHRNTTLVTGIVTIETLDLIGHVISADGIGCDPDKLVAISQLPTPTCEKDVRSVLGMCGYYRSFIAHFSTITGPLTHLLKKEQPFVWGTAQQEAFDNLKAAMISPDVLAHSDPELPIQVRC